MMKSITRLVIAAAMALVVSVPASAATVTFSTLGATTSPISCTNNPTSAVDTTCQVKPFVYLPFGGTVDESGTSYVMFNIVPDGRDRGSADVFTFTTAITLLINELPYTFSALASVVGWNPTGENILNGDAELNWSNIVTALNSPVNVSFLSAGPFNVVSGGLPARILVSAVETSVVPLPGGILLLGSALLGIFGLSRRRNRKLAAA